jgi:cell division FtsZ-interacting protein ZapD
MLKDVIEKNNLKKDLNKKKSNQKNKNQIWYKNKMTEHL